VATDREMNPAMGREARVAVAEGRSLYVREYGLPSGSPVFFFHGVPGSRFQCPDEGEAESLGVRLIALERPGYGLADPVSAPYSLSAWAQDVAAVADVLRVDGFGVVGYSLGGMYALACAHAMPQRVRRLGLVSSFAPLDVPGNWEGLGGIRVFYEMARSDPQALQRVAESLLASPESFVAAIADNASEADQRVFATPAVSSRFLRDARESIRGGSAAVLRDVMIAARPWDLDVTAVRTRVLIWHGMDDISAAPSMARYLAGVLPCSQAWFFPGEGHLLLFTRWREVIGRLAD
jgi:pimeloyl-ACP methyl ester carboxylesterase